jgi:hypothetical protein
MGNLPDECRRGGQNYAHKKAAANAAAKVRRWIKELKI